MSSPRMQRWHLIGLAPMHDAMVRRLARAECSSLQSEDLDLSIAWSVSERLEPWSDWITPTRADVVIVLADRLLEAIDSHGRMSPALAGTETGSSLRLVWGGLDGERNDWTWATAWLASGAITDPTSLQSWMRIAVRQATSVPPPPHPFLRDLKIPLA